MVKGMKQRMMLVVLVVASVGWLAAPAHAQSVSDEFNRIVRLDGEFTDVATGRRYDCRYAVGEEAQRFCVAVAARQERFGYIVVLAGRVLHFNDQDPWSGRRNELEAMQRDEERARQREQRYESEQWRMERKQKPEQQQDQEQVRLRAVPKERISSDSNAAARRPGGSEERRERNRPNGKRNFDRGER